MYLEARAVTKNPVICVSHAPLTDTTVWTRADTEAKLRAGGEGENFSTRPAPDPLPESSAGALKMQDLKMKDQMSGHEDAGLSTKAAVATRKAKFIRRCLLNSSVVFEICSLIVK